MARASGDQFFLTRCALNSILIAPTARWWLALLCCAVCVALWPCGRRAREVGGRKWWAIVTAAGVGGWPARLGLLPCRLAAGQTVAPLGHISSATSEQRATRHTQQQRRSTDPLHCALVTVQPATTATATASESDAGSWAGCVRPQRPAPIDPTPADVAHSHSATALAHRVCVTVRMQQTRSHIVTATATRHSPPARPSVRLPAAAVRHPHPSPPPWTATATATVMRSRTAT